MYLRGTSSRCCHMPDKANSCDYPSWVREKEGARKPSRRAMTVSKGSKLNLAGTSFPTKDPRPRESAILTRVGVELGVVLSTCFASLRLSILTAIAQILLRSTLNPRRILDFLLSHPQSHIAPTCWTMTTISKDAQQSSYPYVMDSRHPTRTTDDKDHYTAR